MASTNSGMLLGITEREREMEEEVMVMQGRSEGKRGRESRGKREGMTRVELERDSEGQER